MMSTMSTAARCIRVSVIHARKVSVFTKAAAIKHKKSALNMIWKNVSNVKRDTSSSGENVCDSDSWIYENYLCI